MKTTSHSDDDLQKEESTKQQKPKSRIITGSEVNQFGEEQFLMLNVPPQPPKPKKP